MPTPLQMKIIETLKVKPVIDAAEEIRTRVDFLKDYLLTSGQNGFVLGVSGGQDSSLVGALGVQACQELKIETGHDYKLLALMLPYGEQRDILDAEAVCSFISAHEVIKFNIKDSVDTLTHEFNQHLNLPSLGGEPLADFHRGNAKARIRMTTQYAYAGTLQRLVLGCDHASESITAFFTSHGDMGVDLNPLDGLNKRQGKQLLRHLNAPEFLLVKNPTADLLDENPLQTDESSLEITYDEIDDYLEGKDISPEQALKLETRFMATGFKRHLPITPSDTWYKEGL